MSSVLTYPTDPDAAVTVLDPRTGYVRAMVGGKDAAYWANDAAGRVNLATGAGGSGRQTGSAFKAFALVTALEHGISPDTTFVAPASIDIPLPGGGYWHVTNAEGNGYGTMSLRSATVYSVNTVYAQLIERLTPEAVVETAQRMGMRCCPKVATPSTPLQPYLSAVLGSNEANTLEMASAYGTLATGGRHVDPLPVVTVSDANGDLLWQADPRPQQVVSPDVAAAADGILQDAVLYGTGTAANIGRPQIGKTGTDDNHDNAWFVGSVPQLTAAIWVGFHQGQIPMEPPRTRITVFGGTFPAQIWRVLMLRATSGMPAESFPTPEVRYLSVAVDVTQRPYCLPNAYTLPHGCGGPAFHRRDRTGPDLHHSHVAPEGHRAVGRGIRAGRRARDTRAERLLRPGADRNEHAAGRDDHLSDAVGWGARLPNEHRHDHRREGAAGRLSDTHGPSIQKRQGRFVPTRIPTRGPERTIADAALGSRSIHISLPRTRSAPSRLRSTSNAWAKRPGPRQRSTIRSVPRRTDMRSMPSSGCPALSKTALPVPFGPVTTFMQWCMP